MSELQEVDAWLAALLANLEPAARTKMLREVARDLRRIQQKNITAQRSPDGTAWEPRRMTARTKQGRIRRKMFTKLKKAKFLKVYSTANEAEVFFAGQAQRIARVHHYGLRERINVYGRYIKNTKRPLLGFNEEALNSMKDVFLRWLTK
ncbi:phage virion morphogenesis protein [Nissabacter archeti]|uniref:phage virion morphogenesis protein n=1 Tax=Nissabacter archeti TaxID=1917880 RepID=UPI0009326DBB|nr:phage virion morphogenesis protein [Nissabacter archeti]